MCFWYQCPELPDPSRDVLEPLAIPNKREIKILNDISYVECYDKSSIIVVWNCQLHDIFIRVLRIANDFFHRMDELWKRKRGKGIFFCVLRYDISSFCLSKVENESSSSSSSTVKMISWQVQSIITDGAMLSSFFRNFCTDLKKIGTYVSFTCILSR